MPTRRRRRATIFRPLQLTVIAVLAVSILPLSAQSQSLADPDFLQTWSREDHPVASGAANRTWLWGPEPFTGELSEPYASSPGSQRTVQYFDKARMEINDPQAERNRWFVTTGLLATELMTGAMQTSDQAFEQRGPALIPVAGDADDRRGPTYASFDRVRNHEPFNTGTTLTATIDRTGLVGSEQRFAGYSVLAERYIPQTGHSVASVFWTYLNQSGTILEDGELTSGRLFDPWFFATGFPVTEAYWAEAIVGGQPKDVLIQVFERRVLTYTPSNQPAWRVELGNVGRHYHAWRYDRAAQIPAPAGETLWEPDLTPIAESATNGAPGQWTIDQDQQAIAVALNPAASHQIVSRYWHGGSVIPVDGYRVSVDVRMSGPAAAGLGTNLTLADGSLASMLYFGVAVDGVRHVTGEDYLAGESEYVLRAVGGLPGWDASPGAWTEIAVTVFHGRLWFEVGSVLAGEIEVRHPSAVAGIALVAEHNGRDHSPATVTFRNLTVQSVTAR